MKKFHWRTTVFGILGIGAQVAAIAVPKYREPLTAVSQVFLGGGLLTAADSSNTATPEVTKDPQPVEPAPGVKPQ